MNPNPTPPIRSPYRKRRRLIGDRGGHFLSRVEGATAANISACYQCERCTNACPVAHFMDIKPHQVMRFTQLGWREELLASTTVWVCLSCEMCTTYCPNEVHVAEVILHLRAMASRSTETPKEIVLAEFHETFLRELQRFGRVNEFWLMAALGLRPGVARAKMASGDWKKEIALGWTLLRKGRLRPIPHRCRAMRGIRRLYRRRRREGA
ncbi:MAG: 4Fe-4S dicluster domain-containing protein [Desulfobacteraceae bacterium]|nr:4Fe-4S dicluster domain-containing protein [Desulfobacteraceae bacterium]